MQQADVDPLLVSADGRRDMERLGGLSTLSVTGAQITLHEIQVDIPTTSISGRQSGQVSKYWHRAFHTGHYPRGYEIPAGLGTKYSQTKSATFEFEEVLVDRIEVLKLDQYLAYADVNPLSRFASELMDPSDLYITTPTIKSKSFTIEAKKSDNTAFEVSAPHMQGVVGGNITVSGQGEVSTKVTYQGSVPLVFEF